MKLPVILAAAVAVVLLAAGYFFVLPMMKGKPAQAVEDDDPTPVAAAKKKKKAHEPGLIYPISERVLNLTSTGGVPHYARIELALEFERPADAKPEKAAKAGGHGAAAPGAAPPLDPALEPVSHRTAQIDDAIVRIVGAKTLDDMTSTDGREKLKQEIQEAVEALVSKPELTGVYIVRLIVQ
jgi:flagellar FliL protein